MDHQEDDSTSSRRLKNWRRDKEETPMLTHIVIWKYRSDIDSEQRKHHVASLRALVGVIPEIRSLEVGFDTLHLPRSYDTGLVAIFDDRAGLDAYTVHPEHMKVAQLGREISEHVASVDFENERATT